jgi:hypothetical protein
MVLQGWDVPSKGRKMKASRKYVRVLLLIRLLEQRYSGRIFLVSWRRRIAEENALPRTGGVGRGTDVGG